MDIGEIVRKSLSDLRFVTALNCESSQKPEKQNFYFRKEEYLFLVTSDFGKYPLLILKKYSSGYRVRHSLR